jgi:hypothetical protein
MSSHLGHGPHHEGKTHAWPDSCTPLLSGHDQHDRVHTISRCIRSAFSKVSVEVSLAVAPHEATAGAFYSLSAQSFARLPGQTSGCKIA